MPARRDRDPMEALGLAFEVSVAEVHARSHPEDLDALRTLAYAYTAAGRLEDALATDRRLVEADPTRADLRYDLACSFALLSRNEEALDELEKAVALGFRDAEHLSEDTDLDGLRKDPRFVAIVALLKK